MKREESPDPTDPRTWLLYAKSNLKLAEKGGRLKKEAVVIAARVVFWAEKSVG